MRSSYDDDNESATTILSLRAFLFQPYKTAVQQPANRFIVHAYGWVSLCSVSLSRDIEDKGHAGFLLLPLLCSQTFLFALHNSSLSTMTSPPFRIMKTYTPQPLGKAGAMSHVFTRNTNPAEFHRHVIQAQNAFSFCNFHQSINHYNNAMEELNANLATTTLLQRATIHEIAGSYNNALNDAKAVIAIDSTLPDGYLSACNTLLLENKYREALLLSREGCQKADWDHPQYEALVELEKSISREVHKQNRWLMNKLPFDVIENVLRMLPLLSRVQLSLTCMDWNEFLCEWTGMWHDVWINHRISRSLPQFLDCVINSQVRTLIIDVEILDKLQSICLHAATHWRNLESLGMLVLVNGSYHHHQQRYLLTTLFIRVALLHTTPARIPDH